MVDVVDKATRSRMMSGIRGRNTKPEIRLRSVLHRAGYRFRLHRRDLPGSPDVVMPSRRIAIFVHGCFWHSHPGCALAAVPKTRPDFWQQKLAGNRTRDELAIKKLRQEGWRVLVVWECAMRQANDTRLLEHLAEWIAGDDQTGEIGQSSTGPRMIVPTTSAI